jgi:hypothetical protein
MGAFVLWSGTSKPISPWVVEMVPKSSMYFSGASDTQVVFFVFFGIANVS